MKNKENWDLRPFQREVLEVFRAFEGICVKHNLRYFAAGGTLLGAIRHHGFIPWDDDFDVMMPREDYNRFHEIASSELPSHLKLRRGGETKDSPIYFSKIVNVREGIVEDIRTKTNLEFDFAPFVDVFALDGLPDDVRDYAKWWRGRRLLRLCQVYRYPKSFTASNVDSEFKRIVLRILGFFVSGFYPPTANNGEMMKLLDEYSMRWSFDQSRMMTDPVVFRMRSKYVFQREMAGDARIVPFEDGVIRVPARAEEFLERWFGDYMTPPPKECQIPEHLFKRAYNHV